jgi:hypothetical protein
VSVLTPDLPPELCRDPGLSSWLVDSEHARALDKTWPDASFPAGTLRCSEFSHGDEPGSLRDLDGVSGLDEERCPVAREMGLLKVQDP